ncbi:MAG: hypothetical protein ACRDQZ_25470 [Mycobacteriales bacterium]
MEPENMEPEKDCWHSRPALLLVEIELGVAVVLLAGILARLWQF